VTRNLLWAWVCAFALHVICRAIPAVAADASERPVAPGVAGQRPFWNQFALRFIYPPAFDFAEIPGAKSYRFNVTGADAKTRRFTADRPTAALSPVWADTPEGVTDVVVEGLNAAGQGIGESRSRTFYRSPGFSGVVDAPARPYQDAAREGLSAIFHAPHVQYWLAEGKPDRSYVKYCYPNKVMGAVARAMAAYSRTAETEEERQTALKLGRLVSDHLLSIRYPAGGPYANVPPTYTLDVDSPTKLVEKRVAERWLMTPSAVDAAFGFLDLYDATQDRKYFEAGRAIADAFKRNQDADGTWPLMVDWQTGKPITPQRLVPTWVIFLFDRMDRQYKAADYREAREKAWQWIETYPLKTYQWDGQFEDVQPRPPYVNLAREQACDVAVLLLSEEHPSAERIAQAEELLRFAEDQFVVWSPVKSPQGWTKVMPKRRQHANKWITPCVLEQYVCYGPVARSSAVLINAYLKAHEVTNKPDYLQKARALANGLVAGQDYLAREHDGKGEIPTWLWRSEPKNWLNNSYYAAEALQHVAEAAGAKQ
jgi:maltose/maltodextrin transport system substrate-binding protein